MAAVEADDEGKNIINHSLCVAGRAAVRGGQQLSYELTKIRDSSALKDESCSVLA